MKGDLGPIETTPLPQDGSSALSIVTFGKKGAEPHFLVKGMVGVLWGLQFP